MLTVSWYAWLALRRRVSMSAIGSVIVMAGGLFLAVVSVARPSAFSLLRCDQVCGAGLPGRLGEAGQLAAVRHLAQADPAPAELAVDRLGPAAALAPRVGAHLELRLAGRLDDQRCLRHVSSPCSAACAACPSVCSSFTAARTGSPGASAAPGPRRRWWRS